MNEGRIWLYVSPTVGIPLFFIAIATVALLVHASILTNTSWYAAYWEGAAAAPAVVEEVTAVTETTAPAPAAPEAPAEAK